MKFHEIADLFPLLQGEDFDTLCQDIAQNGLLEPIWLHPDGSIIDGRNRYLACREIGVEPRFRTWDKGGSLASFVLSFNLYRRHLTSGQRAALAVEIEPFYAEENGRDKGGRPNELNKRNMLPGKPVEFSPPVFPEADKAKSRDQAAQATGTNGRYVSDAKKIKRDDPRVFEQIKSGELNINQANWLASCCRSWGVKTGQARVTN